MPTKKGTGFRKSGTSFPTSAGNGSEHLSYARMISAALQKELCNERGATKIVMEWTGASDRCVKNWFAGAKGPTGKHLIALARNSDSVFWAILQLCSREPQLSLERRMTIRAKLDEAMELLALDSV